jgi:antitoxin MazE
MIATVRKWGHSLAVRIPKSVAQELAFGAGGSLEMRVDGESIVLTPSRTAPSYDLDELLDQVTSVNLHPAVETGAAVGEEFA